MKYNKQPLDIPAQIAMLKGRGLNIADEQAAEKTLSRISYFHLAAYLCPMEADKNTHQYKPNASFENAVKLYEFDAELRELAFRAIGKIEIALRTKMIHHFSLNYNAFWFLKMFICKDEHLFLENLSSIDREIHRSKEDFIKQHYKKYTKPAYPPAWKTLELLSLGTLTKVFTNSSATKTKKAIAQDFDATAFKAFESWLACIASLRNYCAHQGQRLLRIFPNKPTSSRQHRYDNTYVFQELDYINKLRNRIAHHEPICFARPNAVIDTSYVLNQYARMMKLFQWMNVDGASLVYGLDHVGTVSGKVMCI